MKRWILYLLLFFFLIHCGGSPAFTIDVDVGANQLENPFKKLQKMSASQILRGIYFRFDPLTCPITSMNDPSTGSPIYNSDPSLAGADVKTEYDLETTQLSPGVFYRVTMLALDTAGTTTHKGVGDCPVKVALGEANKVTICFGENNPLNLPICPGLTQLAQCPGNPTTCN